jgi:hypothetical protein
MPQLHKHFNVVRNLMILQTLIFVAVLTLLSCENKNSTDTTKDTVESFESFNIKFHNDSLFQISRIRFPLEGKQVDAFEERDWTLKNWVMLKVPVTDKVDTTEYKHTLKKTGAKVEELYWVDESGFSVERHFELEDSKWYLTYFNDVNL